MLEFALNPLALPLVRVLCVNDPASTMLHAIVPFAPILAAIGVSVGALSMLLVVAIVSFIAATVLPHVDAMAVHHSILERALEVAAVSPLEAPVAIHLIV